MNIKMVDAIHKMRDSVSVVKEITHYHLTGDHRFKVDKAMDEICSSLALMYAECLKCQHQNEDMPDETKR